MKIKNLSQIVVPILVFLIGVLYFIYPELLLRLGRWAVSMAPAVVFFAGGIIMVSRDVKRIKHAEQTHEYSQPTELTWLQSLKHDLIMFAIPVILLLWPLVFGQRPGLIDVLQASTAFLACAYLKYLYWQRL